MSASISRNYLIDLVRPDGAGPLRCDEREVLQRIFVTVRDQHWREVAPTECKSEFNEALGLATLTACHQSDSVAFEWKGELRLSEDRLRLHFQFTGRALRDMQVCRVGLVVLHPIELMIGSRVIVTGAHSGYEFTPTEVIAPQPVTNGIPGAITEPFDKLVIERADFGRLDLAFKGDLFELEDQRNWGDLSFKTYCTPLRFGFPRELKAGTVVQHSMEARFTPPRAQQKTPPAGYRSGVIPQLGREWSRADLSDRGSGEPASPWSHIYYDAGSLEDLSELERVLATETTAPLHLAVQAQESALSRDALALIVAHRQRIARIFLYGPGISLPSATAISRWRAVLEKAASDRNIPLSAATRGYFVEINRGVLFDLPVSGIAFPLTATVHSDDPDTICGNVAAVEDMAQTGLRLTGTDHLSITPLALYYPPSRAAQPFPAPLVAPWLTATLIHAALGGIDTVTLANDILESIVSGPHGNRFLACLLDLKDKEVARLSGELPRSLHAIKFICEAPYEPQVLVANLSSSAVEISLAWLGKDLQIATDALSGIPLPVKGGGLVIPGYGVLQLGN